MPKKAEAKTGSSKKEVVKKTTTVKKDVKAEKKETKKTADKEVSKKNIKANPVEKTVDQNSNSSNLKFESSSYKEKVAEIENNILQKIKENPGITGKAFRKLVSVNKLMETGAHIGLTLSLIHI